MYKFNELSVLQNIKELNRLTSDEFGAQRVAYGPVWRKAREWFIQKVEETGASISIDSAGNLWAKIEGEKEEALGIGSHLDSVPNGGTLDGALGVLAGLEILKYFKENFNKPPLTLFLVDFIDEEGARFGHSLTGSTAASGTLDTNLILKLKDKNGIMMKDALKENNIVVIQMGKAFEELKEKKIKAFLELHIEQGPVLENQNVSVAAVSGVAGIFRHLISFKGQAAHAGSFPVPMRNDAFLAAAEVSLKFREIALKYNAVCTVGKVSVHPDVPTIVPSRCEISLDQRSINKEHLIKMRDEAFKTIEETAKKNGVEFTIEKIYSIDPVFFDEKLTSFATESVEEITGKKVVITSGPLHDAARIGQIIPTTMMFVPSQKGLSHCKEEFTEEDSLRKGLLAFFRLAQKIIKS